MAKTILQVIQEHCRRTKLPQPNSAVGSADVQVLQMVGLMNELLEDLTTRKVWQQNTHQTTFTTVATSSQGAISTIAPNGFAAFLPNSFFSRSSTLRIYTGLTAAEWQARQATGIQSGPAYWVRLRNNSLLVSPTPAAGETWAFEYYSTFFVLATDGTTYKEYFTVDSDTLILPDRVAQTWLRWRWKSEKGLDYAEDFARYEMTIEALSRRDQEGRPLNMAGECGDAEAGVVIPVGSWSLP